MIFASKEFDRERTALPMRGRIAILKKISRDRAAHEDILGQAFYTHDPVDDGSQQL